MHITIQVMTITKMSPGHQYPVAALLKRLDDKYRINPAGTHNPYRSDIGWILQSRNTGQISAGIGTPVAQKCSYFGLKIFHYTTSLVIICLPGKIPSSV